jgi:hypothetical protein
MVEIEKGYEFGVPIQYKITSFSKDQGSLITLKTRANVQAGLYITVEKRKGSSLHPVIFSIDRKTVATTSNIWPNEDPSMDPNEAAQESLESSRRSYVLIFELEDDLTQPMYVPPGPYDSFADREKAKIPSKVILVDSIESRTPEESDEYIVYLGTPLDPESYMRDEDIPLFLDKTVGVWIAIAPNTIFFRTFEKP